MFRFINRTTLIFFGLFLIASVGLAVWDLMFVWPRQACEADGAWWDELNNQCLTPIPIWRITGRTLNAPRGGTSTVTSLPAPTALPPLHGEGPTAKPSGVGK